MRRPWGPADPTDLSDLVEATRQWRWAAAAELAWYFHRSGRIRGRNLERLRNEGPLYRKGWEVRFLAHDEAEAARIRGLLVTLGLVPGASYRKRPTGEALIVPIYGKESVAMIRRLVARTHRGG